MPKYRLLPLAAAIFCVPLIVRLKMLGIPAAAESVWYRPDDADLFTWWKVVVMAACALWTIPVVAREFMSGWRPANRLLPALLAAPLLVSLASAGISPFAEVVWLGFPRHYEGVAACATFLYFAWYAAEFVRGEKERDLLLTCLCGAGLLSGVIGAAQSYGHDFWLSGIGSFLRDTPNAGVRVNWSGLGYGTFPNQNTFARFMAMMLVLAAGMIAEGRVRGFRRWLWALLGCVSALALVTNFTRFGIVAAAFGLAALAFMILRRWRGGITEKAAAVLARKRVRSAIALAVVLAAVVAWRQSLVFSALPNSAELWRKTRQSIQSLWSGEEARHVLCGISLQDNTVTLHTSDGACRLSFDAAAPWHFTVLSEDGAAPFPSGAPLRADEAGREAALRCDGIEFPLALRNGRLYGLDGLERWSDAIAAAPAAIFSSSPGLMSGRGYIWSRSLAVAAEKPLLGTGPDTFCLVFPNAEIVEKTRQFPHGVLVDKSDGTWVNILVTQGTLGLFAWMAPFAYAFLVALRAPGRRHAPALAAVLAAYAVSAIVTNSTPGVTLVAFVLCGLAGTAEKAGDGNAFA